MLLKVSICAIVYLSFGIASEGPRDVNICDLTRLADQLDGKLVRVRGILRNSETAAEPFFDELVPENCSDPEGLRIVIQIVSPDVHFLANPPQGYKADMSSIRRAEPIFKNAAARSRPVAVTVEGVFYSARPQRSAPVRHKQYRGSIVLQALRAVKEH